MENCSSHKNLKRLQVRIPPAMREALSNHCTEIGKPPNMLVLSLLKNYLEIVGAYDEKHPFPC